MLDLIIDATENSGPPYIAVYKITAVHDLHLGPIVACVFIFLCLVKGVIRIYVDIIKCIHYTRVNEELHKPRSIKTVQFE